MSDLKNEASVEACFINKLLEDLGYPNSDISFKESISEVVVGKGSAKVLYKPDYIIKVKDIPTVVIDAKSPNEKIESWESQCSSYCLEINKYYEYNPVQIFVLSNGLKTNIYKWDVKKPILSLEFKDFQTDSTLYQELRKILHKQSISSKISIEKENLEDSFFQYEQITLEDLLLKFKKLHQEIWKNEKKSPSAAFLELIKILFIKIEKDKQLHKKLSNNNKPKYKDVIFSTHWISNEKESENPVNDILFKNLVNDLEREIRKGKKKRFFDQDENIMLSPETINKIVKEIEHIDFYGMEEDIHGRMFEAFLDATARGKDIGQFFTPRDIVKLMVGLYDIKVSKLHIDKVLDACCGSGGFLIAALINMLQKSDDLTGLTNKEKEDLKKKIQTESIYGIDAGSEPEIYKIARMNMYLHGDGGSNIFHADSLDKTIAKIGKKDLEIEEQLDELKTLIITSNTKFDLILSNPPFSLKYSRDNKEQEKILDQYDISKDRDGKRIVRTLMSSVMFIERYKELISDEGHIIAIIDDSILSGDSYSNIRTYLRKNFIIKGIISLPGDAFRRSSARVKTSVLYPPESGLREALYPGNMKFERQE